jgi:hypothetical protein
MYQSALSASETAEQMYINQCGEAGMSTVLDCILDECPVSKETQTSLRQTLIAAICDAGVTDLELAEWAAKLVGNPSFEEWYGDQQ